MLTVGIITEAMPQWKLSDFVPVIDSCLHAKPIPTDHITPGSLTKLPLELEVLCQCLHQPSTLQVSACRSARQIPQHARLHFSPINSYGIMKTALLYKFFISFTAKIINYLHLSPHSKRFHVTFWEKFLSQRRFVSL